MLKGFFIMEQDLTRRKEKNEEQREGNDSSKNTLDGYKIPSHSHLSSLVRKEIQQSSWWELYGFDISIAVVALAFVPVGYKLIGQGSTLLFILGFLLLAYIHSVLTVKVAHAAVHNSFMGSSKFLNKIVSIFVIEFWGGFTEAGSYESHIQYHHPYTNVIGLGDSSSWKVPQLDRYSYLFFAPIFLHMSYPFVAVNMLNGKPFAMIRMFVLVSLGYLFQLYLFLHVSGLSLKASLLCIFFVRSVFAIPYIHVNIFQHIGLPMYDPKKKPDNRLQQMAHSVLNLPSNPLLDYNFGVSITSCHIEHHLFPRLSDNMCLKVKPIVRSYLKSHGFPYNEDTYKNRLLMFFNQYEELMVHAPPITELIGIQ